MICDIDIILTSSIRGIEHFFVITWRWRKSKSIAPMKPTNLFSATFPGYFCDLVFPRKTSKSWNFEGKMGLTSKLFGA
jgi:hypothetical protein